MTNEFKIDRFDEWFSEDTGPAAIVLTEYLQPVAGRESVIFPPTYAPEKSSAGRKSEYLIDSLKDGRSLCQIDSVGSQANRMEPIFKNVPYSSLVPQVTIELPSGQRINLLDAGHRAADAIVRFSELNTTLAQAFDAWLKGDASELARIAPTSLVFGAWDSRGTQAKTPRIISATIRAYDVNITTRAAQYSPPVNYVEQGIFEREFLDQKIEDDTVGSKFGLTHVPARAVGGVIVYGEIRREAILNLVAVRALGVPDGRGGLDSEKTLKVRRYILGLALTALTRAMAHNLRQGCLLVTAEGKPAEWKLVKLNGKREGFDVSHDAALSFTQQAVTDFNDKVLEPIEGKFDPRLAKAAAEGKAAQKAAKKASKKSAQQAPNIKTNS